MGKWGIDVGIIARWRSIVGLIKGVAAVAPCTAVACPFGVKGSANKRVVEKTCGGITSPIGLVIILHLIKAGSCASAGVVGKVGGKIVGFKAAKGVYCRCNGTRWGCNACPSGFPTCGISGIVRCKTQSHYAARCRNSAGRCSTRISANKWRCGGGSIVDAQIIVVCLDVKAAKHHSNTCRACWGNGVCPVFVVVIVPTAASRIFKYPFALVNANSPCANLGSRGIGGNKCGTCIARVSSSAARRAYTPFVAGTCC